MQPAQPLSMWSSPRPRQYETYAFREYGLSAYCVPWPICGIKVNWAEVLGTSVPISFRVMFTEMTPGVCHGCDNLSLLEKQLQFAMTQRPSRSLGDARACLAGAAGHPLSTSSSQLLQTASVKRDHEGEAWGPRRNRVRSSRSFGQIPQTRNPSLGESFTSW